MQRLDALVLDLDTRGSLAAARQLGRDGYRLAVASRDPSSSGLRTRYAARRVVLPDPTLDLDLYAGAIVNALARDPADVVIPTIDESLAALHLHRDAIGELAAPALAEREPFEIATSKSRTLDVARELDIAVPRSLAVASADEVADAVAEIGLPAVLKPETSWRPIGAGGERVAPVYLGDMAAGERAALRYVRPDAPALVQELATGARETVKLFRVEHRFVARLVMSVERAWPPLGGSSVMRTTMAPPEDVLGAAERLVAEIGLDGYSEVEFRRDAGGRALLMEVNPRLSQSVEVATRAGVDFPAMQLEWARGGRVDGTSRYAVGLRVGWVAGDLRLLAAGIRGNGPAPRPALGRTLRSIGSDYLLHGARIDSADLADPRPMVAALAFTARSLRR
jgi:biotin carboxylase